MNARRGIHRLSLLFAVGVAIYIFCSAATAYWEEYTLFEGFEREEMFQHIPEKVLGEGYSLKWNLVKGFAIAIGSGVASLVATYLTLRGLIEGSRWVVTWVYKGFCDQKIDRV